MLQPKTPYELGKLAGHKYAETNEREPVPDFSSTKEREQYLEGEYDGRAEKLNEAQHA